jgi:membrane protein YqaA with SNARE-associated domain
MVDWWMGYGAHRGGGQVRTQSNGTTEALEWLEQLGPKACLLAWLPMGR